MGCNRSKVVVKPLLRMCYSVVIPSEIILTLKKNCLHLLLMGINRRIRNTYGLIKKGVKIGFHLADETTWLEKKKIKISNSKGRTLSVMVYFINTSCVAWGGKLFL